MFTAALYQWSVATCPVNIFLDIPLADRLRAAAIASEDEIGGFLVGHFEANKTIVTDFELVESEHRRGTAYALSRRDDQHLISKLNASRKRKRAVVGFFRTHLRPGMFLDAADDATIRGHFNNPQQVALLVKPADDGTATGGFFFWQDGEMDRKGTLLAFPLQSAELDSAKPLPVASPAFDAAATVDDLPRPFIPGAALASARVPAKEFDSQETKINWAPNWLKIGLVAAAAAVAGYFLGTAGHPERFGSRPGDITINAANQTPAAPPPAKKAPAPVAKADSPESETLQPELPPDSAAATVPLAEQRQIRPAKQPRSLPAVRAVSQPSSNRHPVYDDIARSAPPMASHDQSLVAQAPPPPSLEQQPPQVPDSLRSPSAFPHNPNPLPPPSEANRTADASVDLEAVEDGSIKHVMHHIPLLGGTYRGGHDFHPAQVVRRTTPHVPAAVARELTTEVPVDLKLKVDNTGRVSSVELLSRGSDRALVQLAGDAAYGWQFQPAQLKDRPVSSEVIVHFHFRPSL